MAIQCINLLPLDAGKPILNYMSLSLLSLVTGVFTSQPGIPAILTPFAGELAKVTDFSTKAVNMTQVVGFSQPLFPYQLPPLLIGLQMAGVLVFQGVKLCFFLVLVSIVLQFPLDYL